MRPHELDALADSLIDTFPGRDDAPLALALLDRLAEGHPVAPRQLAATTGRGPSEVSGALARWPNVHTDAQARVVAFGGLSLPRTDHRFTVAGRRLHTWCAWDTLFLPSLLGRPGEVRSRCPVTGSPVRLTVVADGVRAAEPPTLWVSFPQPAACSTAEITRTFCRHVHFLAGQTAAERWPERHPGAVVLTLQAAFDLGRRATRTLRVARS